MPVQAHNWLATSTHWPGDSMHPPYSEPFRKDFPTGIAATVSFLRGSYYRAVVDALVHNRGPRAVWEAVNRSPWCAHCQGGHYPVDLYQYLQGHGAHIPSQPGPGTGGSGGGGHRHGRGHRPPTRLPQPGPIPSHPWASQGFKYWATVHGRELPAAAGSIYSLARAILHR